MKNVFFFFTLLTLAAITATPQDQTVNKALSRDDNVRLVVLERILPKTRAEKKKTRCVAVDNDKNPSKSLLSRIQQLAPGVKSNSRCYLDRNDGDLVRDGVTGKEAILFTLSKLKWLGKDRVEVHAGNYTANMSSFGCKYVLINNSGKWKIDSESDCYIS